MIAGEHKQLHAAEPAIEIQEKWIKRDTKFWDENAKKRKMHTHAGRGCCYRSIFFGPNVHLQLLVDEWSESRSAPLCMQSWSIVLQLHRSMHGDHTCLCYGVLR